jgi:hypothetical protein
MPKQKSPTMKKKHYFFLNPYMDCAFTKCPKCETQTKIRKFPLVIHVEPAQMLSIKKECKFCTNCSLIITRKQEIEKLLEIQLTQSNPQCIGNNYLAIGTLELKDWQLGNRGLLSPQDIMERMYVFKDHWEFDVIPAGWYPT